MKKIDLFNIVAEQVRGKNLSSTDVRLAYNDEINSNGGLTDGQRQRWYPRAQELSKLNRITKECSCSK